MADHTDAGQPARPARGTGRGGRVLLAAAALAALLLFLLMAHPTTRLLQALLYFPSADLDPIPVDGPDRFEEIEFSAADGVRLHALWLATPARPPLGHVLLCHGNAGNVSGRIDYARLVSGAGFDVLVFDYRGYGRSEGRPGETGTYLDARAARAALLARPGVDPGRVVYLGESLGGAVALELALAHPPRGLVLQSTFTSVRDVARVHYPSIPRFLVPDAYPTLQRIAGLRAPLLLVHGQRDPIVPFAQGQRLFAAAPEPKLMLEVPRAGHNDVLVRAGTEYARTLREWFETVAAR